MTNATAVANKVEGLEVPAPGIFSIDQSHSHVGFSVRHMMVSKVKGRFADFSGEITVSDDPLQSSVDVTINTASIDTREEARDNHLRTGDFFEVDKYPTITFRGAGVAPKGDGTFALEGELTIRGVTQPVTLDVTQEGVALDPWGNERLGFSATTEIDREDFGLTYNMAIEAGGVVIGKRVKLELDIEAVRKAA